MKVVGKPGSFSECPIFFEAAPERVDSPLHESEKSNALLPFIQLDIISQFSQLVSATRSETNLKTKSRSLDLSNIRYEKNSIHYQSMYKPSQGNCSRKFLTWWLMAIWPKRWVMIEILQRPFSIRIVKLFPELIVIIVLNSGQNPNLEKLQSPKFFWYTQHGRNLSHVIFKQPTRIAHLFKN